MEVEDLNNKLQNATETIENLQHTLSEYEKGNPVLNKTRIISATELGDETIAYITKQ